MKILLVCFIFLYAGFSQAQDVFQESLFSADMVMKNREILKLSDLQAEKIKNIHKKNAGEFSTLKWDLEAENSKLKALLQETKVNQEAVQKQMDMVLSLENTLRKKQLLNLVAIKNELNEKQQEELAKIKGNNRNLTGLASVNSSGGGNAPVAIRLRGGENDKDKPTFYLSEKGRLVKIEDMDDINPNDIQGIEVIKGPSAIDKVGDEGKNGIIIITLMKNSENYLQ